MDREDQHQLQQDVRKTVAFSVVLILCISVPASIGITWRLKNPKQNDGVAGLQFNLAQVYDAVSKCAAAAPSADPLGSCERMQIARSFPYARVLYVVGSLLFLGLTLQLNVAQVSILASVLFVLCNFVFFLDRLVFAAAGAA
uniref:Uncharacterized protein n=1 Tax=Kalanchoe fedtschenkoi TaxID=63787 RepID=A0A7N1A4C9_KALFE